MCIAFFYSLHRTYFITGCRKLFCGNLAYEIDDEAICDFFKDCGELTGLRWLTRKETGEFRVSTSPLNLI
jgi:RNA recognition motif-containing protein